MITRQARVAGVLGLNLIVASSAADIVQFAPDGTLLWRFSGGALASENRRSIEIDADGFVWVARSRFNHGGFQFYPHDAVGKFDQSGTEIATFKGPMADPRGIGFDSDGNAYVAGTLDGQGTSRFVFKFTPNGDHLLTFGYLPVSDYYDLTVTPDDRVFASLDLPASISEFSTGGEQVGSLSVPVTGWGLFLAAGPDSTLGNFHSFNGQPQPDWTTIYDLVSGGTFTFDLNIAPQGEFIAGLRIASDGHILAMDRHGVLYEFSQEGELLGNLPLPGLCDDVRDFAIDQDGNIWVAQNVMGDVDGDGHTGILDLLAVLANWGPCPVPINVCPADTANNDGIVGVGDLMKVLAYWGCEN